MLLTKRWLAWAQMRPLHGGVMMPSAQLKRRGGAMPLWVIVALAAAWPQASMADAPLPPPFDIDAMDRNQDGAVDRREWEAAMAPRWVAEQSSVLDPTAVPGAPQGVVVIGPDGQPQRLTARAQAPQGQASNALAALAAQREARERGSILAARERARAAGSQTSAPPRFADLDTDGDERIMGVEMERARTLWRRAAP